MTLPTRHRVFPREGCFPIQGELGLAILRTPALPIPSFPALCRDDNTHSWNTDDRVINTRGWLLRDKRALTHECEYVSILEISRGAS